MKSSTFNQGIQKQFDTMVKRVVRDTVKNYQKQISRREKNEVPFSDLQKCNVECIGVLDEYEFDSFNFEVGATKVKVYNEHLAYALKDLKEKKRNIVLMFYFLDLSDVHIAKIMDIDPSTSYRNRKNAIEEMKQKIYVRDNI